MWYLRCSACRNWRRHERYTVWVSESEWKRLVASVSYHNSYKNCYGEKMLRDPPSGIVTSPPLANYYESPWENCHQGIIFYGTAPVRHSIFGFFQVTWSIFSLVSGLDLICLVTRTNLSLVPKAFLSQHTLYPHQTFSFPLIAKPYSARTWGGLPTPCLYITWRCKSHFCAWRLPNSSVAPHLLDQSFNPWILRFFWVRNVAKSMPYPTWTRFSCSRNICKPFSESN